MGAVCHVVCVSELCLSRRCWCLAKLCRGGQGGKRSVAQQPSSGVQGGVGGEGGLAWAALRAECLALCTAGLHRGCELCLRVPAEADPSARQSRSAMQVSARRARGDLQPHEPGASLCRNRPVRRGEPRGAGAAPGKARSVSGPVPDPATAR